MAGPSEAAGGGPSWTCTPGRWPRGEDETERGGAARAVRRACGIGGVLRMGWALPDVPPGAWRPAVARVTGVSGIRLCLFRVIQWCLLVFTPPVTRFQVCVCAHICVYIYLCAHMFLRLHVYACTCLCYTSFVCTYMHVCAFHHCECSSQHAVPLLKNRPVRPRARESRGTPRCADAGSGGCSGLGH